MKINLKNNYIYLGHCVFAIFSNSILVKAQTIEEKIKEKNDKIETIVKDQKSAKIYLTDLDNKITQLENEYQKC